MNKKLIAIIVWIIIFWLLFFPKNWLYLDAWAIPITLERGYHVLTSFLSSISLGTYWWYDNSLLLSSRFIGYFFLILPDQLLYILFTVINFVVWYNISKLLFSKNISIIGGILFSFNPLVLSFLNLPSFIFSYTSLGIFLLSVVYIIKTKRWIFVFIIILSLYFLISYTRLIGIYGIFVLILWIFYIKNIVLFIKSNLFYCFKVVILIILSFIPFIFSFIYPYIDGQKLYFTWVWNYANSSTIYSSYLYNGLKYTDFYNFFAIKEISANLANVFQKTDIFSILSFVFIIWILIYIWFFIKYKTKILKLLTAIYLLIIFIIAGPKFLSENVFTSIAYKYFPFIASTTNWLYLIVIPCFIFFVMYAITHTKSKIWKWVLYSWVWIYIFLSIFPFLWIQYNQKLDSIPLKNFPKNIQQTFHSPFWENNPSLFLPADPLYFTWSPYPLYISSNNNSFRTLFSWNSRIVNAKQADLNRLIMGDFNIAQFWVLFNLKNVFVFKDVRNAWPWQFNFFTIKDYESEAKIQYITLLWNDSFYIKQDNENFAQFGLKNDDNYEFFLYTPAKIENYEMEEFFSEENNIDILNKPINIDWNSFQKPNEIDFFEIPEENKNIAIRYKKSVLQPTKIYAKFGNIDVTKPFLVQLNQTFGKSWKIKWISKEEFEEKECIDEYKTFKITQNAYCNYKAQILDIWDTKYLNNPEVPEKNHFEGNFVWNTWLVKPENIPESLKNEKELYAVIIYEKQIWYNWALLISGITFVILILLTIFQEIKNFKNKRKIWKVF